MGLLSGFFLKRAERSFETCLRVIQVDLFTDLRHIYSSQMDGEEAGTLAAQVVNFLKGEDIEELPGLRTSPCALGLWPYCPRFGKGQQNACKLTGRLARSLLQLCVHHPNSSFEAIADKHLSLPSGPIEAQLLPSLQL